MITREQHLERGLRRVTEITHEDEWVNQIAVQFLHEASEMLEENIYLNRLKEQYKTIENGSKANKQFRQTRYFAMREFCLDTQLISFNDIEAMEYEVNQSF